MRKAIAKKARRRQARPKSSAAAEAKGRAMIGDLEELIARMKAGVPLEPKFTVRTVEMPSGPDEYDPAAIRAIRNQFGASQAVFAQLVGVSVKLVQAWEQGERTPALWARRLFDEMNRDPAHWRDMLTDAVPLKAGH